MGMYASHTSNSDYTEADFFHKLVIDLKLYYNAERQ